MDYVVRALRENPELAVFLTLAVGFLIGRLKIGSFSLGTVVGTLLAGVLIGQLNIKVPGTVKSIFFLLFLFTTGYKVGPQFFRGLKRDAVPQVALTVVLCTTCLLTGFAFAKILGYDIGTAAGLLAGAFSESTVIGTAGDAIQRLAISEAEKTGSAELGLGVMSAARHFDIRAYRVTNPSLVNKTVGELEALPKDTRVFVVRIRRGGEIVEATPTSVIRQDDVVAIAAKQEIHVERGTKIGPEVDDKALLDIPVETLDVVETQRAFIGKSLAEVAQLESARGVFLRKLIRGGQEIPISAGTRIDRGDVLRLIGPKPEVERAVKELGYPDRPTTATDMIFVGTGI
ncbi:MAG: aspT, partial [candidate division NC10 bacterium]|nr:aspT [candidate division NC10 bacterium]